MDPSLARLEETTEEFTGSKLQEWRIDTLFSNDVHFQTIWFVIANQKMVSPTFATNLQARINPAGHIPDHEKSTVTALQSCIDTMVEVHTVDGINPAPVNS